MYCLSAPMPPFLCHLFNPYFSSFFHSICYTKQVSNMRDCVFNGKEDIQARNNNNHVIHEEPLVQLTDGEVINFRQLIKATRVSESLDRSRYNKSI